MLLTIALVGGALLLGLLLVRAGERRQFHRTLVTYRLHFPPGLSADAVVSLLGSLSGLLLPWWKRWAVTPVVTVEILANSSGIEHFVSVPNGWAHTVENLLQASVPSVSYEAVDRPALALRLASEYRLSTGGRPLRVDPAALSSRMLASLQPLGHNESVIVQWLITPSGPVRPARLGTGKQSLLVSSDLPSTGEAVTALRRKQAHPLLLTVARIGVGAETPKRARQILRRVEVAWHGSRAPGVHLRRRFLPEQTVASRVIAQRIPVSVWPLILNAEELAGLIGWPIEADQVPGVILAGHRQLAPSPRVPSAGTVIGEATFPGSACPVAIDLEGRRRHLAILGPTGTGKSTLMSSLILQDLEAGHGVILIDPKGDLVDAVTAHMPSHRRDDVIILDPADDSRPVGLNPLRVGGDAGETAVENLVGLFRSLFGASGMGPRSTDILRCALLTLAGTGAATLCEVPLLLTNDAYRRRLVGTLDDPVGLESFWGWFDGLSDAERMSVIGPVLNKLRAFTARPRVRGIIGQADPSLDLRKVLAERKVLLVSLASGTIGSDAADLLGSLIVADLWNAAKARVAEKEDARGFTGVYIDEFQHVVHLPTAMSEVFAEARGMGLGLTVANQHLGQLPSDVQSAVLANARSRVVFQLPAGDARIIARDLGGVLTPEDLQGLGAYEVVAQLFAAGSSQPPLTARTLPMAERTSDGAELREASRKRHGVDRAEVEGAIRARHLTPPSAPVGRRQRGPAS